MFTLYAHPSSANGRKAIAVSLQLMLKPEIILVDVYKGEGQTPDYLAINPWGMIPTLVDNGFVLWESNAVIHYIADVYGHFSLSSQDPKIMADIDRWLFWEASHWQPSISNIIAGPVGHRLVPNLVPKPTEEPNWLEPHFHKNVKFLDHHLKDKAYFVGSTLSIADFSIAGMMTYFRYTKFPFENFPHIERWYKQIEALDAWKNSASPLWEN
jgi:glutathione S-transferase